MQETNRDKIDLSIIIVSWNAKEFLRQCLQSICENINSVTCEIIVVDNDSSDGSPEMVQKEFPQVNLIRTSDNLGFAKANNIGIQQSTARYICLVNSDITIRNGCVETMCSYMDNHPSVGVLGPRILNPDLTLQPTCRGITTPWSALCCALGLHTIFPRSELFGGELMTFWPHDTIRSVDAILGCFLMLRRESMNKVGLLDELYFLYREDIDWCKRFRIAGWEVVYFPDAEAIHYGGSSSSNDPIRFYIEEKRSSFLYWKKYHGKIGMFYIYMILFLAEIIRIIRGITLYIFKPSEKWKFAYQIKRSMECISWLIHV